MHTPGEPDLRVSVMGDSRNKNKISFISPRMLGDADLGTGGAKMTTSAAQSLSANMWQLREDHQLIIRDMQ